MKNKNKFLIEHIKQLENEIVLLKEKLLESYKTSNIFIEREKMKNKILLHELVIAKSQIKNMQRLCVNNC